MTADAHDSASTPVEAAGATALLPEPTPALATVPAPTGDAAKTWPEIDRRRLPDRRRQPTRFFGPLFGPRRRRRGRRKGEDRNVYVDVFDTRDVLLASVIFVLNILDALFTLLYLQAGGAEGNPLMTRMLELGSHAFLFEKTFVVGIWLLVLMMHKNFRIARLGLRMALGLYSSVLVIHFFLQVVEPPPPPLPGDPALVDDL